jgi:thiamine-phosphate pyrophosphorylase
MMAKKQINNGIYLVVDPAMERQMLLSQLEKALTGAVVAVQVWDNFLPGGDIKSLVGQVIALCRPHNIPVLINNRWQLVQQSGLDGVHFDAIPHDFQKENYKGIIGLTCGNDLAAIEKAVALGVDYISFCSMFPSATATSCELVSPETVVKARRLTNIPIFLAGGITPQNIASLHNLPYNGIAVVSGIMKATAPNEAIKEYQSKLNLK